MTPVKGICGHRVDTNTQATIVDGSRLVTFHKRDFAEWSYLMRFGQFRNDREPLIQTGTDGEKAVAKCAIGSQLLHAK